MMKLLIGLVFWYYVGRKIKYETLVSLILGCLAVLVIASIL